MSEPPSGERSGESPSGYRTYLNRWTLLSIATFFYWLAIQSLRPYVPLHLADLGATEAMVGIAIAAHPFLSLFLAIPAGRFIDLRGLRRFMTISLAAMAAVGGLYATVRVVNGLVFVQALDGLAELGSWVSIQALITRVPGETMRRAHLGLFSILWALGVAAGPTAGAFIYSYVGFLGVGLFYSACALVALATVSLVPHRDGGSAGLDKAPEASQGVKRALGKVVGLGRNPGVSITLAATFVMLWANSLRTSFYPLFLEREGIPVTTIGYLVSLAGVTLLIIRFFLPSLLRRYRSVTILLLGTAASVVALVATPALVSPQAFLWAAAGLFGAGFGLNSPITIDMLAHYTEADDRGLVMGMRVASNRLAQVIQPLLFGAVAGALGMTAGFLAAGVVMGGALVWASIKSRQYVAG